jgi:methyl-accepting chemotaxis protein-1 (serine sensor receptor)
MKMLFIGVLAVALVLAAFSARVLVQAIVGPIRAAVTTFEKIASGDLSSEIHARNRDEMGDLLVSLARMQGSLEVMVQGVRASADAISIATAEIAAGNTDLSQRTEQQAASIEETAASVGQLTATVKSNVDSACQGGILAGDASAIATQGGHVVGRVIDTMRGISGSSQKIAEIIGVIQGISFQTNILALNAAVEAARAGEQGRGFAVVAGEVRVLSQRSAAAAKEIKALIEDSVRQVGAGSSLVKEAGETMERTILAVKKVNQIIDAISVASLEQQAGIEEVNQAINQIDQATQQNAALVEQAAGAAASVEAQGSRLRDSVAVFRLRTDLARMGARLAPEPTVMRRA